ECISGDPTFVNVAGNIDLTGAVTATEKLAIIASGDIRIPSSANVSITTTGASSNLVMIAGATVTCTGCNTTFSAPPGTSIGSGKTASVDFTVTNGGSINLATNNTIASGNVISVPSTATVTLAAWSNGTANGAILLPANAAVSGGSIKMFAGGSNGSNTSISS